MANYRTGEIQRAILKTLEGYPDGLPAREVLKKLTERLTLTEFEMADYPSSPGVRRFEKIARFSTISLVKAGWLIKSNGIWVGTEKGKAALEDHPEPNGFKIAADAMYRKWAAGQPNEDETQDAAEEPKISSVTLEEAEEKAWDEVLRYLAEMPPYDFQELVAGLLRGMGYHVSYVSPPGRDQGIDIIAHTDPLGLEVPRIKVQVKRCSDRVAVDGVRSFLAILGETDAGIFVSVGGFTSEAEREARGQERRKIMLVNPSRLFELWTEHYDRIPDEQRRLMPLKPIYYLDLEN